MTILCLTGLRIPLEINQSIHRFNAVAGLVYFVIDQIFHSGLEFLTGLFFTSLGTVLGTLLLATLYTTGIQDTTYNVIADTRQVFDAATAQHYNRVLLQIV